MTEGHRAEQYYLNGQPAYGEGFRNKNLPGEK